MKHRHAALGGHTAKETADLCRGVVWYLFSMFGDSAEDGAQQPHRCSAIGVVEHLS
jgi:hypothetical protein